MGSDFFSPGVQFGFLAPTQARMYIIHTCTHIHTHARTHARTHTHTHTHILVASGLSLPCIYTYTMASTSSERVTGQNKVFSESESPQHFEYRNSFWILITFFYHAAGYRYHFRTLWTMWYLLSHTGSDKPGDTWFHTLEVINQAIHAWFHTLGIMHTAIYVCYIFQIYYSVNWHT